MDHDEVIKNIKNHEVELWKKSSNFVDSVEETNA